MGRVSDSLPMKSGSHTATLTVLIATPHLKSGAFAFAQNQFFGSAVTNCPGEYKARDGVVFQELDVVVQLEFLRGRALSQGQDFAVELEPGVGLEEVLGHDVAGGEELVVGLEGRE